jgi:hypothetical protein
VAKRTRIPRTYNIPEVLVLEAERLGLDAMATGGGLDYIFKNVGKNSDGSPRTALLVSGLDAGSPDRLNERAEIEIMLNEEWNDAVNVPFRTAKEAIEYLAKTYDPYSS